MARINREFERLIFFKINAFFQHFVGLNIIRFNRSRKPKFSFRWKRSLKLKSSHPRFTKSTPRNLIKTADIQVRLHFLFVCASVPKISTLFCSSFSIYWDRTKMKDCFSELRLSKKSLNVTETKNICNPETCLNRSQPMTFNKLDDQFRLNKIKN